MTVPDSRRALYDELEETMTASGEVRVVPARVYIAFRRIKNVGSAIFRTSQQAILLYLRLDPGTVELKEGCTRNVCGVGHLGTGNLEVRIASSADVEKAVPLIRRAVEES
ncbi:DUF5655 domain-containing protein [Kitasatospora sp. NPDC005856]|uniref:DUF5655 domain-containing protein n=1 Tax=Kitasatospora sp. NPDC005856 TaxID=3154566 RepID=UPI0033D92298